MPTKFLVAGLVVLLMGTSGLGATAEPAGAAPQCRERVISDWSDNGRVDRVYPLTCYEEAIDSMPPDIRDYTDAQEIISRALTLAIRNRSAVKPKARPQKPPLAAAGAADTSAPASLPTALLVAGGLGLAILVVGGLGYLGHRATLGRRDTTR